jgi:uncharacterized membrane protein YedE/YeeE
METIGILVGAGLASWWCYTIAKRNGRGTTTAAILGFLFGLIVVIIYYCMGATEEVKIKRAEELLKTK